MNGMQILTCVEKLQKPNYQYIYNTNIAYKSHVLNET